MTDDINEIVYQNLRQKETEELLEILQFSAPEEWDAGTFPIIERILHERGEVIPEVSTSRKIAQQFQDAEAALEEEDWEQALRISESVLALEPNNVEAIIQHGHSLYEMGELEKAIADFQTAIRLDPDAEDAWDDLQIVEEEITEVYLGSELRTRLDEVAEWAVDGEIERAAAEFELLKKDLPSSSAAHSYFGQIAEEIGQIETAIEEYFIATQLNPGYSEAWRYLRKARLELEGENYGKALPADERMELSAADIDPDAIESMDSPLPDWYYLDETAFYLTGWPGHRYLHGRCGFDPLENDFELSHVEGVVIRRLLSGTFRTHNPFYLLIMTFIGLIYCLPLFCFTVLTDRHWWYVIPAFVYIPYIFVGGALLLNVVKSFSQTEDGEEDETGGAFY